jgi:hypothetical protein
MKQLILIICHNFCSLDLVCHLDLVLFSILQAGASSEFQLLLQAISTCAVPLVHQLIQQNPKLIHDKGLSIIISLLFLHTAISTSHFPWHASATEAEILMMHPLVPTRHHYM